MRLFKTLMISAVLLITLLIAKNIFFKNSEAIRIAVFQVDATPQLGSPVAYAPVRSIMDPLSARG